MKPALSALHRRPAVPGDIQDLLATVREVDHVLLQGMNAEGVADAKRLQLALRIVGPDPEFLALPIERRDDLAIGEMCVAEVTEHTGIGGRSEEHTSELQSL